MIGRIVSGKYRIIEQIGAGGMAEVYKAVQLTSPHRTVALKVLKGEYEQDASFLRRFETEAQAVLGLSHDNIVRSYDVGQDGHLHYIVLEYVEGETLKDIIHNNGYLSTRMTINYGTQVLDALHHAHEKGVIHRDVKPQNIIINSRGRAKLADFGIARLTDTENTMTYAGGNVIGSAHYLSPEQAKGESVTVESDIYSMGATLYEMVTGRPPFAGDNPVALALKHIQEDPVPPMEYNPDIPPALNDVIMKALQKTPALRYHSAKDMRRDLLRVLRDPGGSYAKVRPPEDETAAPRNKKARKGRRGVARIALIAGLLIALILALFLTGQTILRNLLTETNDRTPQLIGKTLEEATYTAELRNYSVEVVGTVKSDEYDSGIVVSQKPTSPTALAPGSTIEVTLSEGNGDMAYAPDLFGHTLADAEMLLQQLGLDIGSVDYRESEYPGGTIFRQEPVADAALLPGDTVDVVVSGTPSKTIETPNVLQRELGAGLRILQDSGFTHFRVWHREISTLAGEITYQNPAHGEPAAGDAVIQLCITRSEAPQEYGATLSVTLQVENDDTTFTVMAAMEAEGIPYELVLYETTLRKGQREVSCDLLLDAAGKQELIVLLNGVEWQRLSATFVQL